MTSHHLSTTTTTSTTTNTTGSVAVVAALRSLDDIPSGRCNALVAESDLDAALTALQHHFRYVAPTSKRNLKLLDDDGNNDDNDDDRDRGQDAIELQTRLLKDMSNHVTAYLYRMCQPVIDDLYHEYVRDYCNEYQWPPDDVDDKDEPSDNEMNDENEAEEEFDDDELIDRDAALKVRRLQQQVLERAQRIAATRAIVLQQGADLITQSKTNHPRFPNDTTVASLPLPEPPRNLIATEEVVAATQVKADALRLKLETLQRRFHEAEDKLAQQLEELGKTVSVIERSKSATTQLDQVMRLEFSQEPPGLDGGNAENVSPERRLLQLMQHQ